MAIEVVREKKISRRKFIGGGLATLGVVGLGALELRRQSLLDPVLKVELDQDHELSFGEASDLARRLDRNYDKLPPQEFTGGQEELLEYALEILPQFEYEGIVGKASFPKEVDFKYFPDGDSANHVLGRSDCDSFAILNWRMESPQSTFNKDDVIFTVAHELAHVQQGDTLCSVSETDDIENSAQLGAMEVCAGLANQGNPQYIAATVSELRGMAISTAYQQALQTNRFEEFRTLRGQLSPGAMEEARFSKARRRWDADPMRLNDILYRYNSKPLNLLVNAVQKDTPTIDGLVFPPRYDFQYTGATPVKLPIRFDDSKYLLQHLEEIVDEASKKGSHF